MTAIWTQFPLAKLPLVQRHTANLKISSIAMGSMCLLILYTVSVGQEEGYTVKYTPSVPEADGVYLTGYPESSPNTDSISF